LSFFLNNLISVMCNLISLQSIIYKLGKLSGCVVFIYCGNAFAYCSRNTTQEKN